MTMTCTATSKNAHRGNWKKDSEISIFETCHCQLIPTGDRVGPIMASQANVRLR